MRRNSRDRVCGYENVPGVLHAYLRSGSKFVLLLFIFLIHLVWVGAPSHAFSFGYPISEYGIKFIANLACLPNQIAALADMPLIQEGLPLPRPFL